MPEKSFDELQIEQYAALWADAKDRIVELEKENSKLRAELHEYECDLKHAPHVEVPPKPADDSGWPQIYNVNNTKWTGAEGDKK